jgi:hypothetical protein
MVEDDRRNCLRNWTRKVVGPNCSVGGVRRETGVRGTVSGGMTKTHTPQAATATKTPRTSRAPHSENRRGTVDSVRIQTTRGGRESRRAGDRDRRRPSCSRNRRRIMSPCRRRARRGESEKRVRRQQTAAGRSRRGGRRNQKRTSPFDDGRRYFAEWANSGSWIRSLKGCQIRALEDGKGISIVSSEGEKGRIIPRRDISSGGVKIPIDFILVA